MEGRTKIFRDRVVSLDQTQELGERYASLLAEVVEEALPGFALKEHGLEHEPDLYVLVFENPGSGATRRVAFTRMVLADASRVPAIAESRQAPVRAQMVELIRSRGAVTEFRISLRDLLTEEEQAEADLLEAEYRKKQEALLAARRAEEERREAERRRRKQEEAARRQAERERQERERRDRGRVAAPPGSGSGGRGRGRRRRGRGGSGGAPPSVGAPPQPRAAAPRPAEGGPPKGPPGAPPQGAPGGGGRRRRRRGRRGGGGGSGAPPGPAAPG
jgi:hypothetical protein